MNYHGVGKEDVMLRATRFVLLTALVVASVSPGSAAPLAPEQAALILAAQRGDAAEVQRLLRRGVSANTRGVHQETALMTAAGQGHLAVVKTLLEARADVNLRDGAGGTALINATYFGHAAVVQELIRAGANVDARHSDGSTAMDIARRQGHREIVTILEGAELDSGFEEKPSPQRNGTPPEDIKPPKDLGVL
jgi:serine/threonine-protein phosphatase 6 regulatory ankyrin repeat subunit B